LAQVIFVECMFWGSRILMLLHFVLTLWVLSVKLEPFIKEKQNPDFVLTLSVL
jgi:hypothetical protein